MKKTWDEQRQFPGVKTLKILAYTGVLSSFFENSVDILFREDGWFQVGDFLFEVTLDATGSAIATALVGAIAASLGIAVGSSALSITLAGSVLYSVFESLFVEDLLKNFNATNVQLVSNGVVLGGALFSDGSSGIVDDGISTLDEARDAARKVIEKSGQTFFTEDKRLETFPIVLPSMEILLYKENFLYGFDVRDDTFVKLLAQELKTTPEEIIALNKVQENEKILSNKDTYIEANGRSFFITVIPYLDSAQAQPEDQFLLPVPTGVGRNGSDYLPSIQLNQQSGLFDEIVVVDADGNFPSADSSDGILGIGDERNNLLSTTSFQSAFLLGGAGQDSLLGSYESDVLYGGTGNDVLIGSAFDFLSDSNNILIGGEGQDSLTGSRGNDILIGGDFAKYELNSQGESDFFAMIKQDTDLDTLEAGPGDDVLYIGLKDVSNGGTGKDIAIFEGRCEDLSLKRQENNLVFTDKISKQTITLKDVELGQFLGETSLYTTVDFTKIATPLRANYIGAVEKSDVFRLDLSDLHPMRSIIIEDDALLSGGTGAASGFDLDMVKLSTTFTNAASEVASLSSLQLFDFSTQGTVFEPGLITPWAADDPQEWNQSALSGTNGQQINFSVASLEQIDGTPPGQGGGVSLGEGGRITFNLKGALPNETVYLYFADVGSGSGDLANITVPWL